MEAGRALADEFRSAATPRTLRFVPFYRVQDETYTAYVEIT